MTWRERIEMPFRVLLFGVWSLGDIVLYLLSDFVVHNGRTEQDRSHAIERRSQAQRILDRKYDRLRLPRA